MSVDPNRKYASSGREKNGKKYVDAFRESLLAAGKNFGYLRKIHQFIRLINDLNPFISSKFFGA